MLYSDFQNKQLSLLGFGTMRLPVVNNEIDQPHVERMVDYAIEQGVNYFDTAYPYHGGKSEIAIGRALARHDREKVYLATKYPGHQIASSYEPAAVFEEQLKKCGVEYFDFYLLHNVYENSLQTYLDPKWGIVEYFKEQKRLGRIRHLGFSTHARIDALTAFLDVWGADMEFCQIQLNYLDWTLQDAKASYEFLTSRGIPVWVMEPVRGGRLANLSDEETAKLKAERPEESAAAWAFRFLQDLPNVKMVLSGMSDIRQMVENIETFQSRKPLAEGERHLLMEIADGMKNSVPCTACRYCVEGCPMGLDIPVLLALYNEARFAPSQNVAMRVEALGDKVPSACIGCGKCGAICPQSIDIPAAMQDFAKILSTLPSWAEICRQREEAAKNNKA